MLTPPDLIPGDAERNRLCVIRPGAIIDGGLVVTPATPIRS